MVQEGQRKNYDESDHSPNTFKKSMSEVKDIVDAQNRMSKADKRLRELGSKFPDQHTKNLTQGFSKTDAEEE